MKIVRTKEDITKNTQCRATEENYNTLKNFGLCCYHGDWESISDEHNFLDTDILLIGEEVSYFAWFDYADKLGEEFVLEEFLTNRDNLESLGFLTPETFEVNIFSIYRSASVTEYIGVVNKNISAKWLADGTCVNPSKGYSLYKEYKQKIYTKLNSSGFNPKQKFKVSWTEAMSLGLEKVVGDQQQIMKQKDLKMKITELLQYESDSLSCVIIDGIIEELDKCQFEYVQDQGEFANDIKKMLFIRLIYELICENGWTVKELKSDFNVNAKLAIELLNTKNGR